MSANNIPLDFAKMIPGFDFMKQFAQAAVDTGSAPGMPSWIAPTISVEEIDKHIADLKAVLFWLEQNGNTLRATIQALQVQRMTLGALQGMNMNLSDIAKAFTATSAWPSASSPQAKPTAEPPPEPAPSASHDPQPKPKEEIKSEPKTESKAEGARVHEQPAQSDAAQQQPGMIDPMQWWGALTQQFQSIAANALRQAAAPMPTPTPSSTASPTQESAPKDQTAPDSAKAQAQGHKKSAKKSSSGAKGN